MVVEEHTENMAILLTFLILLLIIIILLMIVTLIMAIIMMYMILSSLKELERKSVKQSVLRSSEQVCAYCSSTLSAPTTSSTRQRTSPLQTEATTEAFQQPVVNVHNNATLHSSIDTGELNDNIDNKDISYIENSSTLQYIYSNLSENENEGVDLIPSNDTEKGINDVTMIVNSNSSHKDEQIEISKADKIKQNIKVSNGFENIETENIKEDETSLEQDNANYDNSLMENGSHSQNIVLDTISKTKEVENFSEIKEIKVSEYNLSMKQDAEVKNIVLDHQDNGSIGRGINETNQHSEDVIYLNSYDSNIENKSSAIEVAQNSVKLGKKSYETASLNSSQIILYDPSSEKVMIKSTSNELLPNETSKNIGAEENYLSISETKITNITNNDVLINSDKISVQVDASSKPSQETSVKKSQEPMQELSSKKVLKSTSMEDFDALKKDTPFVNISVTDVANKDKSTDNTSNRTSVPNDSDASTSPEKIEYSSSAARSSEDALFNLYKEADEMYQNMDYDNLYVFLKKSKIDQKNDEFLWRLGRATWQRAMEEKNESEQLSLHKEALGYVHTALELNESNGSVHRWISIITDYVARTKDVRTRVSQSAVCRDHMFRAVELNPNDGVSWYLLGFWHYCAAELPWYQRQLAKALFSTEFNGTYEQALDYFLKGHKTNKEFYSTNVYMIGRCYQKMGRRDQAITWIRLARDYRPIRTWNDKETHEEATEKLKKLGAK